MEMIKNIITAIGCDLLTRGAQTFCDVMDSLTQKDRKKSENYLVVPNNCVLSLSYRPGLTSPFFSSRIRARGVPCNPCKQRTFRSFLCSFFVRLCEKKF